MAASFSASRWAIAFSEPACDTSLRAMHAACSDTERAMRRGVGAACTGNSIRHTSTTLAGPAIDIASMRLACNAVGCR
ncbi:hypothetical protein [Burkholderia sp. AU18528]|uniref:hypothetical protein n=1 Tax=Burkholderia sp. AU18528 TaxID=2015350 RepID=UPI00211DFB80|nr:hypothetical protein [Burkholderia sp. AU18528]